MKDIVHPNSMDRPGYPRQHFEAFMSEHDLWPFQRLKKSMRGGRSLSHPRMLVGLGIMDGAFQLSRFEVQLTPLRQP